MSPLFLVWSLVFSAMASSPSACPQVDQPVCGADGQTYRNRCLAVAAGVDVRSVGACEDGASDSDASALDTGEGWVCTTVYDPVCGQDGRTYPNRCEAERAGTQIAHEGECAPVTCMAYWEGWYKDDRGTCVFGSTSGCSNPFPYDSERACEADEPEPDTGVICACPRIWAPVCGADGETYSNDCQAACEGVDVAYVGECVGGGVCDAYWEGWYVDRGGACVQGGASGCSNPFPYDSERACEQAQGLDPHDSDSDGPDPDDFDSGIDPADCVCPMIYAPVCGADGETYGNACMAGCHGVDVSHEGPCEVDACDAYWEGWYVDRGGACVQGGASGCSNPFPYDSEQACERAQGVDPGDSDPGDSDPGDSDPGDSDPGDSDGSDPGDSDAGGEPPHCACPKVYAPVCGVDGETYGNACEASCERVDVAHEGPCRGSSDPSDTDAAGDDEETPGSEDDTPEGDDGSDEAPEGDDPATEEGPVDEPDWDTAIPQGAARGDDDVTVGRFGCHTAASGAPAGWGLLTVVSLLGLRRRRAGLLLGR